MSKNFVIFAGNQHYPIGGWNDVYKFTESFEEAIRIYKEVLYSKFDWVHIVDLHNGNIVINAEMDEITNEIEEKKRKDISRYRGWDKY